MSLKYKLGDSVIVKQGIKEPDLEAFEIGGWQGRIVEIDSKSDKDNILITIGWDSFTLKQTASDYIEQSEREGYDWQNMTLYDSDLEKANPRDKKENLKKVQDKLSDKYYWASHGKERIRISKVLDKVNPKVLKGYISRLGTYEKGDRNFKSFESDFAIPEGMSGSPILEVDNISNVVGIATNSSESYTIADSY